MLWVCLKRSRPLFQNCCHKLKHLTFNLPWLDCLIWPCIGEINSYCFWRCETPWRDQTGVCCLHWASDALSQMSPDLTITCSRITSCLTDHISNFYQYRVPIKKDNICYHKVDRHLYQLFISNFQFILQGGPYITVNLYCICLSEHETCA